MFIDLFPPQSFSIALYFFLLTLIRCSNAASSLKDVLFFKDIFIINLQQLMKTVSQLKEQIYDQALNSGYFKNMQAQLKTYVFDLIEKEYNNGKTKTGFQYEHPLLPKLKKFPLTSLCMDLIQEFLQSFKFKHTLNVFKKEINRNVNMNRSHLAQSFKIQIKNPDSQAVLLSLVQQMVSGDIGAVKPETKNNNYVDLKNDRTNNFMGQSTKHQQKNPQPPKQPSNSTGFDKPAKNISNSNNTSSNVNNSSSINSGSNNNTSQNSNTIPKDQSSSNIAQTSKEINSSNSQNEPPKQEEDKKGKKKDTKGKKEPQKEKEKPPQNATDLLGDVMKKFQGSIKPNDKEKQKKQLFQSKRAFSEEKQKKVVDPSESGANKIRGISMGKAATSSFMSKFMPANLQPQKNQSFIDEQLDEFQQSKDSTRKNPLFSSGQSGFDKSGFDYSVDSNAIDEYEYIQRAKKFAKKS